MPQTAEREYGQIGKTAGAEDHDRDIIHELSKRLDALWRIDQYIANADGKPEVQTLWRDFKNQETKNVQRLKDLVKKEISANCF
jgi:GH15 family glucan-1,4-alpha-glucosidase